MDVPHRRTKSNYQSHGVNIPTVWQVTDRPFQGPPPTQTGTAAPPQYTHTHTQNLLSSVDLRSSSIETYRGKKAKRREAVGVWGSATATGLFFERSAQSAQQAISVNGAFFSLPLGEKMLIADNTALIAIMGKQLFVCRICL